MNVITARKSLKSFGWSSFSRVGQWVVYDKTGYNGLYDDRALIKLAQGLRSKNWRPSQHSKTSIGCGGKWCTCCTKASPSEMKKWERRAVRRQNKHYSPFEDSLEYHESFA